MSEMGCTQTEELFDDVGGELAASVSDHNSWGSMSQDDRMQHEKRHVVHRSRGKLGRPSYSNE